LAAVVVVAWGYANRRMKIGVDCDFSAARLLLGRYGCIAMRGTGLGSECGRLWCAPVAQEQPAITFGMSTYER